MGKLYYLYEKHPVPQIVEAIKEKSGKIPLKRAFKKHRTDYEDGSILIVDASDIALASWLGAMRNRQVTILLLPNPSNTLAQKSYALPSDPLQALDLLDDARICNHLVLIDEETLLGRLVIGDASWLEGGIRPTLAMIKNFFGLRLFPITLSNPFTEIKSAAFVIECGEEAYMHSVHPLYFKDSPNLCERATLLLYAPQSLLQAIKLRFAKAKGLPEGVGTIKTRSMTIQTPSRLTLSYNHRHRESQKVVIERISTRFDILTGWKGCQSAPMKESLRIDHLPNEEMAQFLSKRTLPLLPMAPEEAFAELFTKIRSSAKLHTTYLFLFVVSVLMATIGLFQNSAPTIIGAMILAPLMGPVVAFAMGVVRFDAQIVRDSILTILFSLLFGLLLAAFMAKTLPFFHVTQQMSIRTHPTLLDLAVAILSGLAAAYGYSDSKVGESLAGVAIAVALVPPLCVAGIGLGWGDLFMFENALLLVLANIVGIIFAAGVMFYILGFASKKYISAAFMIKLTLLGAIFFPLYLSTKTLLNEEKIYQTLQHTLPKGSYTIEKIVERDHTYVYITLDRSQKRALERIQKRLQNVRFIVIYHEKL